MKPDFIDNRSGNTAASAINGHLEFLRSSHGGATELCVATAYFNPEGLELLSNEIEQVGHMRLLLGAEPGPAYADPVRQPGDPNEPEFTQRRVKNALEGLNAGLARDRNRLPFSAKSSHAIEHLIDLLRSGKIEVRRYEEGFLHAKAYLFHGAHRGVIAGSSNLTRAGLQYNKELNLGAYETPVVAKVHSWFEAMWLEAVPFDLAAIYEAALETYPPHLVYLRVLFELYGSEVEQETQASGGIPVTNFQLHGVWRALMILEKFGGCIIADSVGLGKSFIAGEIMQRYTNRRQRVLLVCPAALRDSAWRDFLDKHRMNVRCVSYEQLAGDRQITGEKSGSNHLVSEMDEYSLVVVDEAHNYRNPDAPTRAKTLAKLLVGTPRKDLVLLTATPVNNSLWDLYHLIQFFVKQDSALASRGVLSIRERFADAQRTDPFNLHPDVLYPIVDATTVKRTRQFIKRHYPHDHIRAADGSLMPIVFPKPIAKSVHYSLDDAMPGLFEKMEELFVGDDQTPPKVGFARYRPTAFLLKDPDPVREDALIGLIRSGLLKRFESSAHALHLTLDRMMRDHERFLAQLAAGRVLATEVIREISAADDEEDVEEIISNNPAVLSASLFNVKELKAEVSSDLECLREIFAATKRSKQPKEGDPKVLALLDALADIHKEAEKEGTSPDDVHQRHKVLIFSYFTDTVDWIEEHLEAAVKKDPRLAAYKGRVASVAGDEHRNGVSREAAVSGFAPVSTRALKGTEDKYDLLISTDVLAEGMNLQQARHIINYDMPWNPMRLIQRHGRIDRIGSTHNRVFLRTIFPDDRLDGLLKLEERIRAKLAQAANSVGVETAPIEDAVETEHVFSETRTEIEKLHEENSELFERGGTEGAAQTGEEYRQELRKALAAEGRAIEQLPWKAGSGFVRASVRGYFFCAKVGDRVYLRFVQASQDWVASSEGILHELGTCLRLIECKPDTDKVIPEQIQRHIYSAWSIAQKHAYENWMHESDPVNLHPRVRKLNKAAADFLRANPPETRSQEVIRQALDIIESPWPRRDENRLREVYEAGSEKDTASARKLRAEAVIDLALQSGILPYEAPEQLPPITIDDVHLVCWLVLSPE